MLTARQPSFGRTVWIGIAILTLLTFVMIQRMQVQITGEIESTATEEIESAAAPHECWDQRRQAVECFSDIVSANMTAFNATHGFNPCSKEVVELPLVWQAFEGKIPSSRVWRPGFIKSPWGMLLPLHTACQQHYRKYMAGACLAYERTTGRKINIAFYSEFDWGEWRQQLNAINIVEPCIATPSTYPPNSLSNMLLVEHRIIHLTTAASAAVCHGDSQQPFDVIEVGARTGVWSMTAGFLFRQLRPQHPLNITVVEPDFTDELSAFIHDQAAANDLDGSLKHIRLGLPDMNIPKLLASYGPGQVELLYYSPQHEYHILWDDLAKSELASKVCRIVIDGYGNEVASEVFKHFVTSTDKPWSMHLLPTGGDGECDSISKGFSYVGSTLGPMWNMHESIILLRNVKNPNCQQALCAKAQDDAETQHSWLFSSTITPGIQQPYQWGFWGEDGLPSHDKKNVTRLCKTDCDHRLTPGCITDPNVIWTG